MAPIALEDSMDDEFIRTISDDDSRYLLIDEPEAIGGNESSLATRDSGHSRKRKANGAPKSTRGTNSKRRKVHDNKDLEDDQSENGLDEEGQDDGAMDPDFEFQVETTNNGVVEDFDFWDVEDGGAQTKNSGYAGKKGVDIDLLIAKRKGKNENSKQNINGASIEVASVSEGSAIDNEDAEDAEEGDDDLVPEFGEEENDDDDELLAEDGFGMGAALNGSHQEEEEASESGDSGGDSGSEDEAVADPMPEPDESGQESDGSGLDAEEDARRKEFFAAEDTSTSLASNKKSSSSNPFQSMSLSRPVLRGLASVGFSKPTPIQMQTIPVALQGKDVVGSAVTGSGKTAAFIIPILERLVYRPKKVPTSRVAILMPTRELAVQCLNVAKKLASFTDITFCLLTGGFSLREQEQVLRGRPDVTIATPGRFIDHMRNSASFTTDTLEILVLDEADRMLDDGFADELDEILRTIPTSRQTMLFSATMTEQLDKLIRAGLKKPVKLMANARKQTVGTLTQEFVRLRPGREKKRLGYLLYLCSSIYKERVIIFFRQKKEAHRARVVFSLNDIKAAELHGSMSQEQRINALTTFRNGQATHLLATDLASRGLDIPFVSVVINYEAPQSHEIYLHRVGRTARAGRAGRACTIAAESDRKIVKQAVKAAKSQGAKVVSRVVDPQLADEWSSKIADQEGEIEEILKEEKEEKLLNQSDVSIRKGENMIKHEDEIHSRPKRTWFETEKDKLKAKKAGREELNGQVGLGKGKSAGKLSKKDKKGLDDKRERLEGRMWKKGKGDSGPAKKTKGKKNSNGPKAKTKLKGKPAAGKFRR